MAEKPEMRPMTAAALRREIPKMRKTVGMYAAKGWVPRTSMVAIEAALNEALSFATGGDTANANAAFKRAWAIWDPHLKEAADDLLRRAKASR